MLCPPYVLTPGTGIRTHEFQAEHFHLHVSNINILIVQNGNKTYPADFTVFQ